MVWWNDISVWTNVHFLEIVWSHRMVWSMHMFFSDERDNLGTASLTAIEKETHKPQTQTRSTDEVWQSHRNRKRDKVPHSPTPGTSSKQQVEAPFESREDPKRRRRSDDEPKTPTIPSGKNMWRHHTIRCDHTISKKWTFVHTEISFDHTINIWSHRKKFVHTINLQDHTVIILFTPCTCWSHSWNFCSHHLNFVHTINFQDHTVIILFTPWRCWSHSWKFCSHHLNFVHTIVY